MHIEEVKIKGFMSIGDEVVWSDLHHALNIIGGRNGSGKSTFLASIRFIFTNDSPCSSERERRAILNDPKEPARVDITIDNSDNRFMLEDRTVHFSRQLTMKQDTYFVNGERKSKYDFHKLLELGQISTIRPIYIVPQGDARRLAMISNVARLKILEECSGLEDFKEKDLKINQFEEQSEIVMQSLTVNLGNLDASLGSLVTNLNDKRKYDSLKKTTDTMTRLLAERRLQEIEDELKNCEGEANNAREAKNGVEIKFQDIVKKNEKLTSSLEFTKRKIEALIEKKSEILAKEKSYEGGKRGIILMERDLENELKISGEEEMKAEIESENLYRQIEKFEGELATGISEYEEKVEELEKIRRQLTEKEVEINEIYAKKSRGRQFSSKVERDEWITNEILRLEVEKNGYQAKLEELTQQIEVDEAAKSELEDKIRSIEREISLQEISVKTHLESSENLIKQKEEISRKLKELRDQLLRKEGELSSGKSILEGAESKLRKLIPRNIFHAMTSVQRAVESLRERGEDTSGYYGLLIDVFQIKKESLILAVETAAGNRLFHHVVASDTLAVKILDEMERGDFPGVAIFLPLDRLRFNVIPDPPTVAIIMLTCLEFEPEVDNAMRFVFNKKWVCRDLDTCLEIATRYKADCITMEGDQVFSIGNMSGGFHKQSDSTFKTYNYKKQLEETVKVLQKELAEINRQIVEANQTMLKVHNELIKPKPLLASDLILKMKTDLENEKSKLILLTERIAQNRKLRNDQETNLEMIQVKIANLQEDLNLELSSQFSEEGENHLEDLQKELSILRKRGMEIRKSVSSLKENNEKIENILNYKLKKDARELEKKKRNSISQAGELRQKIEHLKSQLIDFQEDDISGSELEECVNALKEAKIQNKLQQKQLEEVRELQAKLEKKLRTHSESVANIDLKIKELNNEKLRCEEEFRSVSITRSIARTIEKLGTSELMKQLEKSKEKLSKIKLNPRAEEKYVEDNRFIEEIQPKTEKLMLPPEFAEFMTATKHLATENAEDTLTEVSGHFNRYFSRFVSEGSGQLVKNEADLSVEEDDSVQGIDVQVEFSDGKKKNLHTLSGGEKSVVSLALMFAVTENNAPPFFIFDEVDAALSDTNAEILAIIIKEISRRTQVFVSTFNSRMMKRGDQFFKIFSVNGIAHIQIVSTAEELLQ